MTVASRPAEPTPAATIVLARVLPDDAFEIFLVKRHGRSGFMAGAHVFPGGKLDPQDGAFDVDAAVVCAIRETFEECGVLLARPESGLPLTTYGPIDAVTARTAAGEPCMRSVTKFSSPPEGTPSMTMFPRRATAAP
jgi:8-oxo-dGTP pyrophosphatase MutT (NUDIX family)